MKTSYQQVCDDLLLLMGCAKHHLIQLAEQQGLTNVQVFALYYIYHQDSMGMTMGQIADALHCDASNVTGIVDRLVAQQLVTRKEYEQDRRTKLLTLTDAGRKVVEKLQADLPGKLGCDRLNATERDSLHGVIQKICA